MTIFQYENSDIIGDFHVADSDQTETAQHTACREAVGCLATGCCRKK